MGSVIFIAGAYGVGKSTLCDKITRNCHIKNYSASELISAINGEKYGASKTVRDKDLNQEILIDEIEKRLFDENLIILAGHFCIIGKEGSIEELPKQVFGRMHISAIILLEADSNTVIKNLMVRDAKPYSERQIKDLMSLERECAVDCANTHNLPLFVLDMSFSELDERRAIGFIMETYGENVIRY